MNLPTHLLAVLTPDHPGVLATITANVAAADGDVIELAQTLMFGYGTMTLGIRLPSGANADGLRSAIADELSTAAGSRVGVVVHPWIAEKSRPASADRAGNVFILTGSGEDRPGVLAEITRAVSTVGGNFLDLSARIEAGRFTIVAEIAIPKGVDLAALQTDLLARGESVGLAIRLQHDRLFRATSEVAFPRLERV